MSNGSISLLRANPKLTTNYKLVVDRKYNLYLESYNTNTELADKRFKKFLINSESFISQRLAAFYNGLPTDLAFDIRNDIKSDTIQNNYNNQYDDIYYSGPRQIEDTRYVEEFQYNTTLKINPEKLPTNFFIFRADGPGLSLDNPGKPLIDSNVPDFFNNLKIVSTFDLTEKTNIGKLWKKNYIDDDVLPRSPIELNFKQFEFSQWNGYDYFTGGSTSKSFFIDEVFQKQTTDFELETFITDGFQKNGIICSNYSNISYLYDDTVSGIFNPDQTYTANEYPFILKLIQNNTIVKDVDYEELITPELSFKFKKPVPYRKKWTINRYVGFYIDKIKDITKVTSYIPVPFKDDDTIEIINNVFTKDNDPISPIFGAWDDNLPIYFKIENTAYLVERIIDVNAVGGFQYILIADKNISGNMNTFIKNADKPIKIVYEESAPLSGVFHSYLKNIDDSYFYDKRFLKYKNGIVTININDQYYRLQFNHTESKTYILTDEYIICDQNALYTKLGETTEKIINMKVLSKDNNINYFNIQYLQFTEVNDWDFDHIDTKHASMEYDQNNTINLSRPFVFNEDVKNTDIPRDIYYEKYYNIWYNDGVTDTLLNSNSYILPQSSEYAASGDLYMLDSSELLTKIWDINQSINKWTISKSINTNGAGYKINNSLDVSGTYNFTPNIYEPNKSINDLNLDWFYTLGKPLNHSFGDYTNTFETYTNSRNSNIIFRTLNLDLMLVENIIPNKITNHYRFDIDYYKNKNAKLDYFDYILNTPFKIDKDIINPTDNPNIDNQIKRISYVQPSDNVNGPNVYFKGIHAYLQYVNLDNPNDISTNYSVTPANDLTGYGFAILFTPRYETNSELHGQVGIEIILNKIHKNILFNIYMNVPIGSFTSIDYRKRDNIYTETNILYSVYDSMSGTTKWVDSFVPTQVLTLNNITRILKTNKLTDDKLKAGIKYTVVDNIQEFTVTEFNIIGSELFITFSEDTKYKEGSWIKINNSNIPEFNNNNVQIVRKINNKTVVVNTNTTAIPAIPSLITITNNISVFPFQLNIIEPDLISIDKNVNKLAPGPVINVPPSNTFIKYPDIVVVKDKNDNGLIPHVYVDDSITRQIFKNNFNQELNYNDILKLPKIYRFSADYDAELNNIEIFNNTELSAYDTTSTLTNIDFDITTKNISIHVLNSTNIAPGDIIYFGLSNTFNFLSYKTFDVLNVEPSLLGAGLVRVTLNNIFDVSTITTNETVITGEPYGAYTHIIDVPYAPTGITAINIYLFKVLEKNTNMFYTYKNFGIEKNVIVSKVYNTINPLKTSFDIYNTDNKYPMIDEHGVTTINRNIFKSSWDKEYYFLTIKNTYIKK